METKKIYFVSASTRGNGQAQSKNLKEGARIRDCSTFVPSRRFFSHSFDDFMLLKHMVTLLKEAVKVLISQDVSKPHRNLVIFLTYEQQGRSSK